MKCVKNLLYFFNALFVIFGIAVTILGVIILRSLLDYSPIIDVTVPAYILIIIGVVVFIVAFFGCCGAAKENHCMITTFAVFLLILFVLELGVGITGFVRRKEIGGMVKTSLNESLNEYSRIPLIRKTWDLTQNDLKCCGIDNPSDWHSVYGNDTLPHTCCKNKMSNETCYDDSKDLFEEGCSMKLKQLFENKINIIAGVGLGFTIIQLFGVIFGCMLSRTIKKQYEIV